ncbi:MAG: HAMP domain-containing protein [Bacteroidaceae bacterium]|nr:HAMP domain-containing protein [Bacteroidaceae bacterium]
MKLKSLFLILACLLIAVWIILLFITTQENGWRFYFIEGITTVSLIYLVYFYKKVIKPLNSIAGGMDLLRAQDFSSRLAPVGQQEADRIVQVFNRMMDQLKEERLRLREQNHFLDLLISVSPMGVIILTLDERISMANKAALDFLDEGTEADIQDKTIDELSSSLAEELSRMPKDTTATIRLSDSRIYRCSRLSFIDRGFAHPFFLIESLTSEVMKAEKKAYEKVIRMIAHEVNNSVAGITSTLDTVDDALQSMEDTEDLREVMKVCIERSYSMSRFITNFADVVKIPEPQLEEVQLNDRVIACKLFMENVCHHRNIALRMELCEENPIVCMDTSLFEQVIINIIKNAAESIGTNGEIIIRTSDSPAMLEIGDTGTGISKEVEAKLFTPFFSTKPNGQGIGLIFIREVLMKHNCTFSLRTYPDGITRFRITF